MRETALYIRKSTDDKQINSFHIQKEAMQMYCNGYLNIVHTFMESGTGKNLNRKKLTSAFRWLDADKDRVLVFYKVDRYGRNIDQFNTLRKYINRDQIRFMDIQSPVQAADMLLIQIKISLAEQESRLLGQRIAATYKFFERQGRGWGKSSKELGEMRKKSIATNRQKSKVEGERMLAMDEMLAKSGRHTLKSKVEWLNENKFFTSTGSKFTTSSYHRVISRTKARKTVGEQ